MPTVMYPPGMSEDSVRNGLQARRREDVRGHGIHQSPDCPLLWAHARHPCHHLHVEALKEF